MDRKSFIKSNKQRRRIITAREIVHAIKIGKLSQNMFYFVGNEELNKCYTCAIGAAVAFKCDFNPSCVIDISNSCYSNRYQAVVSMGECGFSVDFTRFVESIFEDSYYYTIWEYEELKDKLQQEYPDRQDRLLAVWQTIYDNKGSYPGYTGNL